MITTLLVFVIITAVVAWSALGMWLAMHWINGVDFASTGSDTWWLVAWLLWCSVTLTALTRCLQVWR